MLNGSASKFLTALLGVVASGLATYYGTATWEPIVVMVLTAIGVYLVPNTVPVIVNPPTNVQDAPVDIQPSWPDQHATSEPTTGVSNVA